MVESLCGWRFRAKTAERGRRDAFRLRESHVKRVSETRAQRASKGVDPLFVNDHHLLFLRQTHLLSNWVARTRRLHLREEMRRRQRLEP